VGGVKFLLCLSANRIAATGWLEWEIWAVQFGVGTVCDRRNYKRTDSMTLSMDQVNGGGGGKEGKSNI
jgi:hypothetical protein